MAIGRVSGSMLVSNLDRQGADLQFTTGNQPLFYLNFSQFKAGINTNVVSQTLTINGNLSTSGLVFDGNTISTKNGGSITLLGNANLGSIGNVKITGGTNGYIIKTDGNGNLSFVDVSTVAGSIYGNAVQMGANTAGALVSNAVSFTTTTSVTNGIAQLNQVLGKLVPPAPPTFPGSNSIVINGLSSYRMTTVSQVDLTGNSRTVAAGATVANVIRTSSYTTSNISTVGPGDVGTITAYKNGVSMGSRVLTAGPDNGTFGHLVIGNNVDYGIVTGAAQGFWESCNVYATGSNVSPGWNEVYINHSQGLPSNVRWWYYDASSPGTPAFSSPTIVNSSNVVLYSSTVPHYTNSATFTVSVAVNRLSGDMYPTSDTFFTGTSGGAFAAPASVTYAGAGISTPLAANLYVASGSTVVSTTASIISGFGSSSTGPSVTVNNSYATGNQSFTSALASTVLYKTGTSSLMEETNITFGSVVGSGSGAAVRIINPGSTDTPAYSAGATAFNSQTSTLQTYDATIVGAVLKHDQTNYSTGYLPAGPNLSVGRSGSQYFTFKFVRTSVSKFNIKFTGTIAGMWVALPGSSIDAASTINGWLDMSTAYAGSGIPGANTGAGGNGSNGCALGGVVTLNNAVTAHSKTCTFGTVSSSSTATNEIYVRIELTSGQSVTALSLETASN